MGGVLFQLSPYFKNEGQALDRLAKVLDSLAQKEYDIAVEFRHRSWLDESGDNLDPATLEVLKERNAATVLIDGPGHYPCKTLTADHAYLRFHGRNYDIWYRREKEADHRLDRYDYLYDKDQLDRWVPRIKDVELKTVNKVRMYFNNHARAKAVRNAFQIMDMLLIKHKSKEVHLQISLLLVSLDNRRIGGIILASRLTGLSPNLASRFTPGTSISNYEVLRPFNRDIDVPFRKHYAER